LLSDAPEVVSFEAADAEDLVEIVIERSASAFVRS